MEKLTQFTGTLGNLVMVIAAIAIILVWFILSIVRGEMQKLTPEQVAFLLGVTGFQAWQQKKNGTPTNPTSPT